MLTQEALAARSEVHLTYVNRLENGRCDPRLSTVLKLARGLRVDPRRLV